MTADAGAIHQAPSWRIDLNPTVVTVAGSVGARLAVGALAVLVAFHFSLLTLVRDLGLDTPLAYLGLVPFISVGIALALPRNNKGLAIYDRQLDHIVGLPIAAAAVIAIRVLPHRLTTVYWDDRIDLLTLPFFVFGISVLLFGVRTTWRYRIPVLFLFMAWPLPYALAIEHAIDFSTSTTISALAWTLHYIPVASQQTGDGSLFTIHHGGGSFPVSIASACAGVNSLVGFVLVGTAFLAVVGRKPPRGGGGTTNTKAVGRKLVWLLMGLTLVWALNIVRLLIVLWTGKAFGETVALDGLHPFIGVVIFAAAVIVLLLAMPLLGLQAFPGAEPMARRAKKSGATGLARIGVAREALAQPIAATGAWKLATAATLAAAIVVGVTDSSFSHYELLASDFGTPKLMGFDAHNPVIPGFSGAKTNDYDWVKRYFGDSATWHRYQYGATGGVTPASYTTGSAATAVPASASSVSAAAALNGTVIADVIDSPNLGAFNAYGIEACYRFHGYTFSHEKALDLGAGVRGATLAYRDPASGTTWSVLYWVWAVQTAHGKRFERVVLLHPSSLQAVADSNPDSEPLKGVGYNASGSGSVTPSAGDVAGETAFAKTVIAHQPVVAQSRTTA